MSLAVAVLTASELEALIARAIEAGAEAIRSHPPSEILTREQVAEMLQVHVRVVTNYVRTKALPCVYVNRQLRFRRGEVLQWLEGQGTK